MKTLIVIVLFFISISYSNGQTPPFFNLLSITGDTISSTSFVGIPVYINVFETYCAPCIAEIPDLNNLSQKYPDMIFVAITPANKTKVIRLLKKHPIDFTVIPDASGLCKALEVRGYPSHFFIDKDGILHKVNQGFQLKFESKPSNAEISKALRELTYNRLDSLMLIYNQ